VEERSPTLEDLRGLLYEWQTLQKSPGYLRMQQYAKDQVDRRVRELILEPGEAGVTFARGECAGIWLFARMADIEIERLQHEITQQAEKEEENTYVPDHSDEQSSAP